MKCKRLNEVIELLQPAWQKEPDLNLLQFLQKLAKESGFDGELADLTDDILIYHLKMRDSAKDAVIPGLQKDYEEDFKTALLRARGVIKVKACKRRNQNHREMISFIIRNVFRMMG